MTRGTGRSARDASADADARKRVKRWTQSREDIFLEELAATANVSHAARVADISATSAHNRKRSDPAFAEAWRQALAVGYAELEMHLLRQSINGSERTESVTNEDGTIRQMKTVHSYPHVLAMRLLAMHREEVVRYRTMEAVRDGADPDVVERVRTEMAKLRARMEAEEDWEEAGDSEAGDRDPYSDLDPDGR